MRFGLVSDVHANLEALTAVLRELERRKVDRVLCLGDVVGYHANPNECAELLARSDALTIAGNHDRAAVGTIEPSDFGPTARRAIYWTRQVLLAEHAGRLRELDVFTWLDQRICLVHAALHPTPNDKYHLTTPVRVAASFEKLHSGEIPARLCFFGHTHRAAVHHSNGHGIRELSLGPEPLHLDLDGGYYLVNPGSVGQPRERDRRAAFAIFDDRAFSLEVHRVAYDEERCLQKAAAAGLLTDGRSVWKRVVGRLTGARSRNRALP
jgi:predicted phosphodiesterase